jgi:predicted DNA-binding transcriptional regulator AlpA
MDGSLHTFWTLKEVCAYLRRARAQVDRYRRDDPTFPKPFRLGEQDRGTLLFHTHKIIAWATTRPPAKGLKPPPADDSE